MPGFAEAHNVVKYGWWLGTSASNTGWLSMVGGWIAISCILPLSWEFLLIPTDELVDFHIFSEGWLNHQLVQSGLFGGCNSFHGSL